MSFLKWYIFILNCTYDLLNLWVLPIEIESIYTYGIALLHTMSCDVLRVLPSICLRKAITFCIYATDFYLFIVTPMIK